MVLLALTALALLVVTGTRAETLSTGWESGWPAWPWPSWAAGRWVAGAFRQAERRAASARHPSTGRPGLYDREADESLGTREESGKGGRRAGWPDADRPGADGRAAAAGAGAAGADDGRRGGRRGGRGAERRRGGYDDAPATAATPCR